MLNLIAVFAGGGIGAVLRYLSGVWFVKTLHLNMPSATFTVNIAGCFILGFLYILFINKTDWNYAVKLALTAGFCGGLTTFSTFSAEVFEMVRTAQYVQAGSYVLLSVIAGLIAVTIGAYFAKFCI